MIKQKNKKFNKSNKDQATVRGKIYSGIVISAKQPKTAKVQRTIFKYISKYERYKKIKSVITVHVPSNLKVEEGDIVKIGETRRLSKTKSFIVLKILGHRRVEETEYLEEAEKRALKETNPEKDMTKKIGKTDKKSQKEIEEIPKSEEVVEAGE